MTSKTRVRKFKFFWADQVAEQEQWLRQMAKQGLHLEKLNVLFIWTFVQGQPADTVYRIDFNNNESADYLQLLEDAGWVRTASLAGWQYWRTDARTGRAPELFTDTKSRKARFERLLIQILLCFLPIAILLSSAESRQAVSELSPPFVAVILPLLAFSIVGLLRLLIRLATMRSEPS